ncbi:MAG: trypsin-like peptidase domain-containing protein [Anaerolineae bacterium]|nr:trypsin-like peptidase domain-containing protein [Anaerolineae bacterium]
MLLLISSSIAQSTKAQEGQSDEDASLIAARQATVFLMQTYEQSGAQVISCVGSGTLISSTGLILTNAHLVEALGPCRGERIIVQLPVRLDEPPIPTYIASVIQSDIRLDLAVLQISGGLDGSLVEAQTLDLPYVTLGDSSQLGPGKMIHYIGYPDIGTTSVTATERLISGMTVEKSGGRMAWLRTHPAIEGSMGGGGAFDAKGRLVGIITGASPTDGKLPGSYCMSIQDNNRDGLITERDACVPVGGPITAVRPASFALPLIEAAGNNFRIDRASGFQDTAPTAAPVLYRLLFSQGISDAGLPSRLVTSLPSGTTNLFLFFDYDNMRPGTPYEMRVTSNGIEIPEFGLGPLAWGGDRRGTWYIGTEEALWPDGSYDFTLLLSGQAVATASISIGGAANEPAFSNLTLGIPNGLGGFLTSGMLFPAETKQIDAQFSFSNMSDDKDWTEIWYLDGQEVSRTVRLWDKGSSGQASVSAVNYEGLPMGTYRLELLSGQQLMATGDIILAGTSNAQSESAVFSNPRIANDITRDNEPSGVIGSAMPLGTSTLYAFTDWDLMPNGTHWTYRWFLDGRLVAGSSQNWNNGGVGQNFWVSLFSDQPLPEGSYDVEFLVENRPMFSHNVTIGSGTRPVSGEIQESEAVEISGTVIDALTGQGISGALIAVLDVKLESPDFVYDEKQIYSQAISDQEGHFVLSRALPRGQYYTVFVFADGYITIKEDNFVIRRAQTSPVDIIIEMGRP